MSASGRRRHTAEFKRHAVAQMADCPNISALAAQLGVRRKFLYLWREQLQRDGETAFLRGPGRPPTASAPATATGPSLARDPRDQQLAAQQQRIASLERQLGQKQLEVAFFKRTFAPVRGAAPATTSRGATASTAASTPGSRAKVNRD